MYVWSINVTDTTLSFEISVEFKSYLVLSEKKMIANGHIWNKRMNRIDTNRRNDWQMWILTVSVVVAILVILDS